MEQNLFALYEQMEQLFNVDFYRLTPTIFPIELVSLAETIVQYHKQIEELPNGPMKEVLKQWMIDIVTGNHEKLPEFHGDTYARPVRNIHLPEPSFDKMKDYEFVKYGNVVAVLHFLRSLFLPKMTDEEWDANINQNVRDRVEYDEDMRADLRSTARTNVQLQPLGYDIHSPPNMDYMVRTEQRKGRKKLDDELYEKFKDDHLGWMNIQRAKDEDWMRMNPLELQRGFRKYTDYIESRKLHDAQEALGVEERKREDQQRDVLRGRLHRFPQRQNQTRRSPKKSRSQSRDRSRSRDRRPSPKQSPHQRTQQTDPYDGTEKYGGKSRAQKRARKRARKRTIKY